MKKLIFIVLVTLSFYSFCQPIRVKGVEIKGSLNRIVHRLENNGCTTLINSRDACILEGFVSGYFSGITITTITNELGYEVSIIFPSCTTWSKLESEYNNIKDILIQKYGNPTKRDDQMLDSTISNNQKLSIIRQQDSSIGCYWNMGEFHIFFHLCYLAERDDYYPLLTYIDNIEFKAKKHEVYNDL